jgi:hypothetical protein
MAFDPWSCKLAPVCGWVATPDCRAECATYEPRPTYHGVHPTLARYDRDCGPMSDYREECLRAGVKP